MNDEDAPIIHTFNADIEEELHRKDASMINIAVAKKVHVEPEPAPNYRALTLLTLLFVCVGAIGYATNSYITAINLQQPELPDVVVSTSTTITAPISKARLLDIMPNSNITIDPYVMLYAQSNDRVILKVKNYTGLINILIKSEDIIMADMKKHFKIDKDFGPFGDISYNNWDLRVASSTSPIQMSPIVSTSSDSVASTTATSTMAEVATAVDISTIVYGIANKQYVILANSISEWERAYNELIK